MHAIIRSSQEISDVFTLVPLSHPCPLLKKGNMNFVEEQASEWHSSRDRHHPPIDHTLVASTRDLGSHY